MADPVQHPPPPATPYENIALVKHTTDVHIGDIKQRRLHCHPALTSPWLADLPLTKSPRAKLVDRAYADPGIDWSADAAKWAADTVKSSFLSVTAAGLEVVVAMDPTSCA